MVNVIVGIIAGAIIGWVASIMMRANEQQDVLLNIIVGVVGALIAGLRLTPLFGISIINQGNFSLPALMVSLAGAVILLAVVTALRGRQLSRR